jgi:hypothetical protein
VAGAERLAAVVAAGPDFLQIVSLFPRLSFLQALLKNNKNSFKSDHNYRF